MDEVSVIVLDPGSDTTKTGFAGDLLPGLIFPTIVGKDSGNRFLVGDDAAHLDQIVYPIRGYERDWSNLERIIEHSFKQLNMSPSETPMLIAEPPYLPRSHREKLAQIMFETFEVCAMYTVPSSKLSLYASGKHEGIVLESGERLTNIVPILEGEPIFNWNTQDKICPYSGNQLTEWTAKKLLSENRIQLDDGIIRDIKEKLGCLECEDKNNISIEYQLPDGKKISIGQERFHFLQPLFDAEKGIHKALIAALPPDLNEQETQNIWNNIVLSGGTTLSNGLSNRLEKELKLAGVAKCNIFENPERMYNTWIGGSVLASMNYFMQICWSKEEYDETGPNIVRPRRHCCG